MFKKYLLIVMLFCAVGAFAQNGSNPSVSHTQLFLSFFEEKPQQELEDNFKTIKKEWQESDEILALETIYLLKRSKYHLKILNLLEKETGKNYGRDFNKWYEYIWNKPSNEDLNYFQFKAELHKKIDPKFYKYFINRTAQSKIRLDEVRWGGVVQDGIPPLRNPKMISASVENYLNDDDVIFGLEINGDVRAYPKRILAWHEMFTDTIGGVDVAGVYCTLCGTVILYKTEHKGVKHTIGTSGFLYRSNKLMYDKETQSLWSTHSGKPVIGPLINKGIELEYLSVVTTDWKTWKERHPNTKVLSLKTGHHRDYNEGAAYKNYFSTDRLMFNVPKIDPVLKNKDEVLVIRLKDQSNKTIAIASKFLKNKTLYSGVLDGNKYTVFTDNSGAHRVFLTGNTTFQKYDGFKNAIDNNGNSWLIEENKLIETNNKQNLKRLHTYNAFWFGLKAAFPEVELIY